MFKVTLLFGRPKDEVAFEEYFHDVHLPLGAAVPGIDRIEVHRLDVISSTMSPQPDLYRMVDLSFASEDHLRAALASPECQAALADLGNFATGGVTAMTSAVEEVPVASRAG